MIFGISGTKRLSVIERCPYGEVRLYVLCYLKNNDNHGLLLFWIELNSSFFRKGAFCTLFNVSFYSFFSRSQLTIAISSITSMNNHSAMIKNERKKLAKERENMWPGGRQPETKGSPRRGKQHIEKKKKTESTIGKSVHQNTRWTLKKNQYSWYNQRINSNRTNEINLICS